MFGVSLRLRVRACVCVYIYVFVCVHTFACVRVGMRDCIHERVRLLANNIAALSFVHVAVFMSSIISCCLLSLTPFAPTAKIVLRDGAWEVGCECQALYVVDKCWHEAEITAILGDGKFEVRCDKRAMWRLR